MSHGLGESGLLGLGLYFKLNSKLVGWHTSKRGPQTDRTMIVVPKLKLD